MSEWLPIQSAPKDGSLILLWFPQGAWCIEDKHGIGFWGGEGEDEDWYQSECDSKSLCTFGDLPTHWMPLPDAPKP